MIVEHNVYNQEWDDITGDIAEHADIDFVQRDGNQGQKYYYPNLV